MDIKVINPFFYLVLLLLASCQARSSWQVDKVSGASEPFASSRLCSRTEDPLHGMDVEIIRNGPHLNTYLSIHSRHFIPLKEDPSSVLVTLKTADKTETFSAYLMEGRQKCLLPLEGTDFLLGNLNSNREIIILLTGYRRSLSPRSFEKQYRAFSHSSSWNIPFQFKL